MTHALTRFIRGEMDERGWRNVDLEKKSTLSKQLVSKLVNDSRDRLSRLPDRATIEGLAKAFSVPPTSVLAKAVEALDLASTPAISSHPSESCQTRISSRRWGVDFGLSGTTLGRGRPTR